MPSFQLHFEWDLAKESANFRKHGVRFVPAQSVFYDPLAISRHDDEHAPREERWVTIGQTHELALVVVVHTYEARDDERVVVRIISARRATAHERRNYETNRYRVQERTSPLATREKAMKDEYDFSIGERGKFYREGAVHILPVHLELDVVAQLSALAETSHVDASTLANAILKRGIAGLTAGSRT
jgi:uncharacterized DUF497 family protein